MVIFLGILATLFLFGLIIFYGIALQKGWIQDSEEDESQGPRLN